MNYIVTRKANTDLINIWEYTFEHWSVEQADKYIRILTSKFIEISKNPDIGKNYDGVMNNYRGLIVKSHIIFYKILPSENIEIIRVLHQRMDLIKRIKVDHQIND